MWSNKQIVIASVLVISGSINTLTAKWTDRQSSPGRDGKERKFDHPYLQTFVLFIAEILCLLLFNIIIFFRRIRDVGELDEVVKPLVNHKVVRFNRLIFLPPAILDVLTTNLSYLGLTLTYASSFIMLRSSVIIFTGIFSAILINKYLTFSKWFAIALIVTGLVVVGLSDFTSLRGSGLGNSYMITGDQLIIIAQIIAAAQMVYEEKFVGDYEVPALQAVGWEGVFGFIIMGILLVPFYYIHVPPPFSKNPRGVLEDVVDALYQLRNSPSLLTVFLISIISIAFNRFSGVSVTKELSATTRMVLDSIRTLVIWMFSLAVGWQKFSYIQAIGFFLLVIGMCLYNDVFIKLLRRWGFAQIPPPNNEPPVALQTHAIQATCTTKSRK